jgi:hypothetical protein
MPRGLVPVGGEPVTRHNCPQCIAEIPGKENLVSGDIVVSDCSHYPPMEPFEMNTMFISESGARCDSIVKAFLEQGLREGIPDCGGIVLQPESGIMKVADRITLAIVLEDANGNGHSHRKSWCEPELLANEEPITQLIGDQLREAVKHIKSLRGKQ